MTATPETEAVSYSFLGNQDEQAASSLIASTDGNLYSNSPSGADGPEGSVFKLTPTGVFTTIYNLNILNSADGCGSRKG